MGKGNQTTDRERKGWPSCLRQSLGRQTDDTKINITDGFKLARA